jgi:osmotically-inducible protein OsmY
MPTHAPHAAGRFERGLTLVLAIIAAVALSACDRQHGDQTAGQKLDGAIASAEQKSARARDDTERAVEHGKAAVAGAAQDIRQMAGDAADKVSDAAITASVNAELARDPKLSALRINVNTVGGNVVLKGNAPDRDARDRATALARNVKGVTQVDNQLVVTSTG